MQRGYIKLWRKTIDSGLLQMPETFALFSFILMKATHKKIKVGSPLGFIDIDAGQYVSGRIQLAAELKQSEQTIRTGLDRLVKAEILTIKSTSRFSIYTIVNYGEYQGDADDDNQVSNQQTTSSQPAANQQPTTKQTHKHINTEEKKQYSSAEFDKFWESWPKSPRKGAKSNCLRVWENRKLNNEIDSILAHVQYCKNNGVWKDPQFISAPLVYLNQSKWDGAEVVAKPNQPFSIDEFMRQVNGK